MNVDPASVEWNVIVGVALVVVAGGAESIAVSGGVESST
jgi:hypothetical protein